ncbi:MAG: hypothetical protein GY906_08085 [bacterium]|nr:hypothetical protein [bacterium]
MPRASLIALLSASLTILLYSGPVDAREPLNYDETVTAIENAAQADWISVEQIGSSVEGRALHLVHLSHGPTTAGWKLLFFGQQHGNEPAGREALTQLISTVAADPNALPEDVDLWIIPTVNPDGGEKSVRRNANDADLNRDHLLLAQPETQALHAAVRRVQPDIVVDCHEFGRDSSAYTAKGWNRWPVITMGTANHPFLPKSIFEVGLEWVEAARAPMAKAGFAYDRYVVGGAPPDAEIRPSTLEANDGRNGLASLGSLGFIIESGRFANTDDPHADLNLRVDAYLTLLRRFLDDPSLRNASLEGVLEARNRDLPTHIPTNFFWGNAEAKTAKIRVTQLPERGTLEVESGNIMHDRIVKKSIRVPSGYAIEASQAEVYAELLNRQGISFQRLEEATDLRAEGARLVRVEKVDDPVYERYAGLQIVSPLPRENHTFARGTLIVGLQQPFAVRILQLLEPNLLYGMYQYQEFQDTVAWDGTIPVWRLEILP